MEKQHPTLTLVELEKNEIPENIRRLQEKLGFAPGEPITKESFHRLVLVRLKREKHHVRCKTEKRKNLMPDAKLPAKPKTEKKKISMEQYRNIYGKRKNPESMIARQNCDVKYNPVERKISAKEKAYSNWGVPKIGKSVDKIRSDNFKQSMDETDLRRSIMKRKLEENFEGAKRMKMTAGRSS